MTETPAAPHDGPLETAVPEWNPLATVEPVRISLKSSGGRAAIWCRPWSGRERLAYEDAITEKLLTVDDKGEETIRIGTLRLFSVALTVVRSEGFGRDGFLCGSHADRMNDLLSITDRATYDEILAEALKVQPLPTAGGEDAGDDEGEDDDGDDPSRVPPTPQITAGGDDESESPAG